MAKKQDSVYLFSEVYCPDILVGLRDEMRAKPVRALAHIRTLRWELDDIEKEAVTRLLEVAFMSFTNDEKIQ